MSKVLAYHAIFSTYGFWLPNDPRGSGSDYVASPALRPFGPATKTDSRRSVADRPHDIRIRIEAKKHLKYPPVEFDGLQARAVIQGFREYVVRNGITIWACAIMPNHVHLVEKRHKYSIEQIVRLLRQNATRVLIAEGHHPFQDLIDEDGKPPTCWGEGFRRIFLFDDEGIRRRIKYVKDNPIEAGFKPQHWDFVEQYDSPDE